MNLDKANIPVFEAKKVDLPDVPFLSYKPNFLKIKHAWTEFGTFKNLLIIGHGGSITSFMGMYGALATAVHHKQVYFLNTTDPDYIAQLKNLPKHETLVVAISKSGETVTQIEALMHFIDYPLLAITSKGSTLEQIVKKVPHAHIIEHPAIGGRYTALTEVALIPAVICGLDIRAMYDGASALYQQYKSENIAMQAAQIFYALEDHGYVDVFMPFYSHALFAFSNLIVQLNHESFGKGGKGQTYFAHEAPESQHHTNQRFFGGRKNIAGFFINQEHFQHDSSTEVPAGMHSIHIKGGSLFEINKIKLSASMQAEFKGTWEDAKINGIPIVALNIAQVAPKEIGEFIAFWQLFAVYSALLRHVNPFDQPQVENSKLISWNKRRSLKS